MNRYERAPGNPYKAVIDGLWPQLGVDDPRQYAWDKAYGEVATRTPAYRDPETGQLRFVAEGEPDPLRDPVMLLGITCLPEVHFGHAAPVLAEVWQTTWGRLFVAALPGTLLDPDESSREPFAAPAAARAARRRRQPPPANAAEGEPWSPSRSPSSASCSTTTCPPASGSGAAGTAPRGLTVIFLMPPSRRWPGRRARTRPEFPESDWTASWRYPRGSSQSRAQPRTVGAPRSYAPGGRPGA